MSSLRTSIYVDGFNLYYGCLKGSRYKWLNLDALVKSILRPENQIHSINYFTARVTNNKANPDVTTRQNLYLRALKTLPHVQVHFGNFQTHKKEMRLVEPLNVQVEVPFGQTMRVKTQKEALVWVTTEKGSDVNLATRLLVDGFNDVFDVAAVVTNDSDLSSAINHVNKALKKPVLVLNPHAENRNSRPSYELAQVAKKVMPIMKTHLAQSQFPITLSDRSGPFHKPNEW